MMETPHSRPIAPPQQGETQEGILTPSVSSSLLPPTSPPPQDDWHRDPSVSLAWCYRYLVAREATDNDETAARRARVSVPIVLREAKRNPAFAALRLRAINRTLTLGVEDGTHLAREATGSVIQDALEESRSPTIAPRDRVTNRRLILETAGAIGGGASPPTTQAVQVIVQVSTVPGARDARDVEPKPAPQPTP